MKICIISFDFWNYDEHIVEALRKKNIDAYHINIGSFKHKNNFARIKNAFSKLFLKKNLKQHLRQEFIIQQLRSLGQQDQILVINPELIEQKYHEQIKKYTSKYIAYLYDSLARCPAEHLLDLFDEVFSFDKNDAEKHHFKLITNYNYLPENQISTETKFGLVYLASFDKRIQKLYKITRRLDLLNINFQYVIVGKKAWMKTMQNLASMIKTRGSKIYTVKRIPHKKIPEYYKKGKVLLDLTRENQTGLSFRFFEAMALKKKIITDNQTVSDYDFYNPNNILIIKEDISNLNPDFFNTDYQELKPEIYHKYTLDNWVKTVFNL